MLGVMPDQIPRKMRTARHHVRNGCAIILIARTMALEKLIETFDAFRHSVSRL